MAYFPLSWFKLKHWYFILQVWPELDWSWAKSEQSRGGGLHITLQRTGVPVKHCVLWSFIFNKKTQSLTFVLFGSFLYVFAFVFVFIFVFVFAFGQGWSSPSRLNTNPDNLSHNDQIWPLIFKLIFPIFFNKTDPSPLYVFVDHLCMYYCSQRQRRDFFCQASLIAWHVPSPIYVHLGPWISIFPV